MKFSRAATAAILIAAGVGIAGCGSTQRALGMGKATPDEFRVVTKAPLVVPPDYSLRPPTPGQPRPAELQPESAQRVALLSQAQGEQRSPGERLLASKAGAANADPLARYVVDDEFGDLAHKDKSFADKVMFWKKGDEAPAVAGQTSDAEKVRAATGGQQVVIQQRRDSKLKLPGL
jgi:DUF3035 family protein